MKAGQVVFQQLLNGKIQYRVPLFQRTYSWEEENWQRLWDDILEVYALEQPRNHFMGAVVTLPMQDAPEHTTKFMLIDGQQRLTSLLLLLTVIRAAAVAAGEDELADQILEECLINKFAKRSDERHKMRPTQRDLSPFSDAMEGTSPDSESQIGRAHAFFTAALAKGDLNGQPIDISRLKSCVTDYLDLVSITLEEADSPHRIFESLNNTGMALTASDLVRNHIFMQIKSESELNRAYDTYWFPMQSKMERPEGKSYMSDFFWRYLMKDGDLPRYDEVFEAMKAHVDALVTGEGESIVKVLEDIKRFAEFYLALVEPAEHETTTELREQLMRLNQWEVEVAYPFLLDAYDRRYQDRISESDLLEVLRMIESYVVRRFVCGIPTNRLRRIFARMARQIPDDGYIAECHSYLLKNEWPSDEGFHQQFQKARIYVPSRLSRTRLILGSLEASYEHHEPVEMGDPITIEHLMPQTLSESWKEQVGQDYAEVHERYLHTIGNLTFSGYNTEMGNEPFEHKKRILKQSHFELNRDIVKADTWTEAQIRARASDLADRALTIWRREGYAD